MPSRLNAPVLTLDAAKIHQIDPRNVESLFGMWTVFNKCSQSIKDGSRLENMSWRLWARETLCCPPQPEKMIVPAIDIPLGRASEVPSLSNSLASNDSNSDNEPPERRSNPRKSEDSALSKSRGKEPHLTPFALEKIVINIQEKAELGPLPASIEACLPPMRDPIVDFPKRQLSQVEEERQEDDRARQLQNSTDSCLSAATTALTTSTTRQSDHRNSDTSVSSDGLIRSGSVVHGFSPKISTSFRLRQGSGLPVPPSKLASKPAMKPGMFQLGASSEDDDNSSFEQKIMNLKSAHQRSSLSQSLSKQNLQQGGALQKKNTSFRDIVEQRRIQEDAENDEGAIASSDDEEDEESAIEDDDEEGDWEDSNSDDEKAPAPTEHLFRRVDSRPNLVSRPSMLSMQIDQNKKSGLSNLASRSSPAFRRSRAATPNGPSMPGSPEENEEDGGLMMQGSKSRPRPIIMTTTNSQHGMAHSPRTTRRNMLSTELTESLRKNLLWERQQKSQAVNAFLKRSRNAQSMANLPAAANAASAANPIVPTTVPPRPPPMVKETSKNNSWNHYFENPWEYNMKGW